MEMVVPKACLKKGRNAGIHSWFKKGEHISLKIRDKEWRLHRERGGTNAALSDQILPWARGGMGGG